MLKKEEKKSKTYLLLFQPTPPSRPRAAAVETVGRPRYPSPLRPVGRAGKCEEVASLAPDLVGARSRPQQHLGLGLVRAGGVHGRHAEPAALPRRHVERASVQSSRSHGPRTTSFPSPRPASPCTTRLIVPLFNGNESRLVKNYEKRQDLLQQELTFRRFLSLLPV